MDDKSTHGVSLKFVQKHMNKSKTDKYQKFAVTDFTSFKGIVFFTGLPANKMNDLVNILWSRYLCYVSSKKVKSSPGGTLDTPEKFFYKPADNTKLMGSIKNQNQFYKDAASWVAPQIVLAGGTGIKEDCITGWGQCNWFAEKSLADLSQNAVGKDFTTVKELTVTKSSENQSGIGAHNFCIVRTNGADLVHCDLWMLALGFGSTNSICEVKNCAIDWNWKDLRSYEVWDAIKGKLNKK
jgi:hypothetical protein